MSNPRLRVRRQAIKRARKSRHHERLFSGGLLLLVAAGLLLGFNLFNARAQPELSQAVVTPEFQIAAPQVEPGPAVVAMSGPNDLPFDAQISGLVGLVAGHKGYDPGAVCDDGLTEAEVNERIALEVSKLLERRGVNTQVMAEFDEGLTGFQADALVSIHADSCNVPGASGFKVARVTDSAIPEAEDLLVACLNEHYATYTGLPQHPSTITDGMTNYHAFSEIAQQTPGAIIETGFLLADRHLLHGKPKIVARGIAAGILCFLGHPPS